MGICFEQGVLGMVDQINKWVFAILRPVLHLNDILRKWIGYNG